MLQMFKKYSSAKKAAEGTPVVRISDVRDWREAVYIAGASEVDEISVISADGGITGHITMRHLDRLGNGNYAVATQPITENAYEPPTSDRVGLLMGKPEAFELWGVLDKVLAGQHIDPSEKLRWTRDRLARLLQVEQV